MEQANQDKIVPEVNAIAAQRTFRGTLFRNERFLIGAATILLFLVFWEVAGRRNWIDQMFISRPSLVVRAAIQLITSRDFYGHLYVSAIEFLVGFSAALIVGVGFGLFIGWYKNLEYSFEPFIMALYSTPRDALIPLIIIWVGIGLYSKIAVVFLGAVFPIVVNTVAGIQNVDPVLIRAARSFGADEKNIFRKVVLPASLPYMVAGFRLGVGRGLIGFVIGEMYVAERGIGFLIMRAGSVLRTDELLFLVSIIAAFGVLSTQLIRKFEEKVGRWRFERNL